MTPTMPLRADNEPNDRFGYSCYVIAIPASESLIDAQQAIWRRFPSDRAAIPAHMTVKGTFVQITDLEEVLGIMRSVASETPKFWISFDGAEEVWSEKGGILKALVFPQIQQLHDALVRHISPISELRYPDDPYWAHMSLTSKYESGGIQEIRAAFEDFDWGSGIQAESINLFGRVDHAIGGEWKLIESVPLS